MIRIDTSSRMRQPPNTPVTATNQLKSNNTELHALVAVEQARLHQAGTAGSMEVISDGRASPMRLSSLSRKSPGPRSSGISDMKNTTSAASRFVRTRIEPVNLKQNHRVETYEVIETNGSRRDIADGDSRHEATPITGSEPYDTDDSHYDLPEILAFLMACCLVSGAILMIVLLSY